MREWEWKKNKKRMEEKYKLFKEMIMKEEEWNKEDEEWEWKKNERRMKEEEE